MTIFAAAELSIRSITPKFRTCGSIVFIVLAAFISLHAFMTVTEIRIFPSYAFSITGRHLMIFYNGSTKKLNDPTDGKQESSVKKSFRLTLCAMVHNEVPYLIEWIEFHRLQGVDHFVLYNYYSTDSMEYIPMLYEPYRMNLTIRISPARFFGHERNDASFEETFNYTMVDCYIRYRQYSHFMLLATAGHFVFSPMYNSVQDFLESEAENMSALRIPALKFGTSGVSGKFRTWLGPDSYTGGVDLLYEPVNNDTDGYPLVMETNKYRAPHPGLDEIVNSDAVNGTDDEKTTTTCVGSSYITLIRGSRYCTKLNMSECLAPQTDTVTVGFSKLRADNHEWRSTEHARSLMNLGLVYPFQYQFICDQWYSRILDTLKLEKYGMAVKENIMKLQPRIFLDVGRECNERALASGQQVKCPVEYPHPFGNDGLRQLFKCCKYDSDDENKPLTEHSENCLNNSFVKCKDPKGKGKWLHRSCCDPMRSVMTVVTMMETNDKDLQVY